MFQISKGLHKPFIIFLNIKSFSITTIFQGLNILLVFGCFIVQIRFVLIMAEEILVWIVTLLGTDILIKNIGSMTLSTNGFNIQLV